MRNICLLFLLFFAFGSSAMQEKPIVFQPEFKWADGSITKQGTGSMVKGRNGVSIGLTSSHFLDFSGPGLVEASWLEIENEKPVASSKKFYGKPGKGIFKEPFDLRSDYVLFMMEGTTPNALELDLRKTIPLKEKIWFPNKNHEVSSGCSLIEGTVIEAEEGYLAVKLDRKIDLRSRSGTPAISQSTGKIIGILSSGKTEKEASFLYLAPAFAISKALLETQPEIPFRE